MAFLFFLPLIDTRSWEKKGKIITWLTYAFLFYAAAMTVWSLL